MISAFKLASFLSEDEYNQIYFIHKQNYYDKNIGLPIRDWIHNLKIKYHNVFEKIVQIFYSIDDGKKICGYNIILKPVIIENTLWSKIIEGGAHEANKKNNSYIFLKMYKDLLQWKPELNYIGEASIEYIAVRELLIKSGFKINNDPAKIEKLLMFFFNSNNFCLDFDKRNCIVKRNTAINSEYQAIVLTYEPFN